MKSQITQLSLFGGADHDKKRPPSKGFKVVSVHKIDDEQVKKRKELYERFLALSDHLDKEQSEPA